MSEMQSSEEGRIEGSDGKVLDEVLGELYVFLVRESNLVLNYLYKETIIDRYRIRTTI